MLTFRSFEERWEWLLSFMALDDPFSCEILTLMTVEQNEAIGTMGVTVDGTHIRLLYSRKFVESLSDECVRYVLTHEISHLVLHHCTTRKPADPKDMQRHNDAADLEINSLIVETRSRKRPAEGLYPEKLGLPEMLSLEQYFTLLKKKEQSDKGQGKGTGSGQGGANSDTQDKGQGNQGFDNHDGWSDENDLIADEIIRQKIREMENSDRFWGQMSGEAKQHILEAQKSRIAWHKLLRYRLGQLVSKNFVHTFKRPNRRFGYPYTGFKRDSIDRILLLWDLSGSIQDAEKSRFLAETNRIAEQQPVDVLMFDYGLIGKVVPFNRKLKTISVEGGGGGTSFKEPFEYADTMRYGTVICLTDGCADTIEKPKHVKHVLWAIVGGGKPPVDWGQVINIDTIDGRVVAPIAKEA